MFRLVCLLIGYAIGCIQVAFIVGKVFAKIDIREHGSGNAGTTNVARILGAKAGIIVFIGDVLKGIIAYIVCSLIFGGGGTFSENPDHLPGLYAGFGAILGHDFPFYLKFKGGKGTATTLGMIFCINPILAVVTYIFGFITAFTTKYISLASLVMTLVSVILGFYLKFTIEENLIIILIMLLSYYSHRENIVRLIKGKERKISVKKK